MIGIIAPHPEEVKPLLGSLVAEETQSRLRHEFHLGRLAGHSVVITTTGVGKVRAAARTQFLIDHFDITKLIFVGIAGAIDPQLKGGDIVVCRRALEHDFVALIESRPHEADPQLVKLALKAGEKVGLSEKLHIGTVLTGDQTIAQQSRKQQLWQTFGGDCVDMEGAAVAMVCRMNKVPFVIIRAISDLADESAASEVLQWIQEAIQSSSSLVLEMLRTLK
jgi:adenosylhomocysteine nucleosidase